MFLQAFTLRRLSAAQVLDRFTCGKVFIGSDNRNLAIIVLIILCLVETPSFQRLCAI